MKLVSIVIVIVTIIVGLGVCTKNSLFNSLETSTENVITAQTEALNKDLEAYCGEKVRESYIEMLVKRVNMYNVNDMFPEAVIIENESNLTLSKDGNSYTITATTEQTNQYYKVEAEYNNETGYISKVIISDAT